MYELAVQRDFVAQHFLVGGDWGPENEWHSHHYRVEVCFTADELDQHGYLVDIVDVEQNLDEMVAGYKDKTLNDLPDFDGLNPSIEHFCRIFCVGMDERLDAPNITTIKVTIWENDIAWAAYRLERD
ncbi:MAG: 6-carboxytetrahydropterin synthase [Chloroflexi bacterium]|nr:6-carboxytetrahydropterin synthase [Chloroflexota bacterium]